VYEGQEQTTIYATNWKAISRQQIKMEFYSMELQNDTKSVQVMTLFKQDMHSYMIRIGTNLDHLSLIHHFN